MICRKCKQEVPDGAFCIYCGTQQKKPRGAPKKRGNGQGSVYKTPSGKYRAIVVLGYYTDEEGKKHKRTHSKVFDKKTDAVNALPSLRIVSEKKAKDKITFKQLYDKWLPTHRAGKSTIDCYKAGMKYFKPVWNMTMEEIDIDDLQDCLDNCGKGKRTQQNMKAVCGLVYKYGIPRRCTPNNLNLAQFLIVGGESSTHRESFTEEQIKLIKDSIGSVDYADYVYCMIYLGFRPSEFLSLEISNYDRSRQCFIGGSKTSAGMNRVVTISPKIQPIIERIAEGRESGPFFFGRDGRMITLDNFTDDYFYHVLECCGIDNPMVEIAGGVRRHKYTPHSCRHTFATLMKRVEAPSKDKQELIGHASEEMLKYYQDVEISDLRRITDKI
ncbi:MAG: site-specific integrase [Oscillospiraceae bacterium]|nr:site-specific integrase [Oscillospiraceae bacterium]